MTRFKLALVRFLVVGASLAIGVWQFKEGSHRETFGNPMLDAGPLWSAGLALVMASIPVIFFAVGSWLVLTHTLFAKGEIAEYRARKLIENARKTIANKGDAKPVQSGHDFIK